LLRTLFPKWREIYIIIEDTKDLTTLSYDHLVGSLMSHEERFETPNVWSMEEKAFTSKEVESSARGRGRGRGKYPLRGRGRGIS